MSQLTRLAATAGALLHCNSSGTGKFASRPEGPERTIAAAGSQG